MGMAHLHQLAWRAARQRNNVSHFEITEYPVVRLACSFIIAKEAEEYKHIAYADPLPFQMGLRSPALAKKALAGIGKHRIVMAEISCTKPAFARNGSLLAEPQIAIRRAREAAAGDR